MSKRSHCANRATSRGMVSVAGQGIFPEQQSPCVGVEPTSVPTGPEAPWRGRVLRSCPSTGRPVHSSLDPRSPGNQCEALPSCSQGKAQHATPQRPPQPEAPASPGCREGPHPGRAAPGPGPARAGSWDPSRTKQRPALAQRVFYRFHWGQILYSLSQ